jgi:predicted transcriptional regulator
MKTALPITGYGMMAERHWREHRPNMVRELEAQGKLEEALYEAQEQTTDEMLAIMERLETEQGLTVQQSKDAAWEIVRERYILLPAEEDDE